MTLAIIPARGGSKRIPGKNTRLFCGKPLIGYSIETARQSGVFDKIIVSTDSPEVAKVAMDFGAEVPFMRPANLSDDYTGTRDVTNHAIKVMQSKGVEFEYVCCIYPTAPLLRPEFLRTGLNRLVAQKDMAFAFSATSFAFPIQRALKRSGSGVAPMFEESINKRSQDLPEAFHDAGQFYWGRVHHYLSDKAFFSEYGIPIMLPRYLVQDIDTLEDWRCAELLYQACANASA